MVLNALQVPAPSTPEYEPDYTFAQDNLVDARTEQILPRDALAKIGMTLDQIGKIPALHSVTVEVHHPNDCDFAGFPPGGEHLSGSEGSLRSRKLLTQDHRPGAGWPYLSVGCL